MLSRKVAIRRSSSSFLGFAAAGVLAAGSRNRMLLRFVLHGLLWALVGSGGAVLPSAEAQDLNVNTDTTISSAESYDSTYVAPNGSDTAALEVTTGGALTNNRGLYVGLGGRGTLNVTGGSVTNAFGYVGFYDGSVGAVTVSSGTWTNSSDLYVGYSDPGIGEFASGTLTMTGGLVTVSGILNRDSVTGTINLNAGGTLQIGTGGAGSGLAVGNLTNNGTLAFNQSDNYTYSDAISGSGAVTKAGAGTLTLSGNNSYTGGVTISGGTLAMGSSTALGSSGSLAVNDGTLDVRGSFLLMVNALSGSTAGTIRSGVAGRVELTATAATSSTYAGTIVNGSGTFGFRKTGAGTLTFSGSNSYTGGTTISGGTLQIGAGGTTGFIAGNVINNAAIAFNRSDALSFSGTVSGSGALTKSGLGSLTLTGSNTYTGGTTISGGTLQIGSGGTTGRIAGNVVNNATLAFNRSNSQTFAGAISGTGAVTKQGAGQLMFAGANSYSGLTTVSAGTVALSGTGSIGTGGLNLGTTGSPGVFDLLSLTAGTYSLPSTGNLAGVGTITGNGKTLAVLGSLAPGNSAGTITVGSGVSLDLSNSGSSVFEITSPTFTAGTFDLVSGDGSVAFGGILNLAFSGGSYADGTEVLQIFANTGGRSGNFSAVNATGLAAGQSATFNPTTGFITVVPEPSTIALMASASAGLAGMMRWRKRRAAKAAA